MIVIVENGMLMKYLDQVLNFEMVAMVIVVVPHDANGGIGHYYHWYLSYLIDNIQAGVGTGTYEKMFRNKFYKRQRQMKKLTLHCAVRHFDNDDRNYSKYLDYCHEIHSVNVALHD